MLDIAVTNGGVERYTVRAPRKEDIPENDRVRRHASDFIWEAILQGAISTVAVRGIVQY